jgi:hypothetical protein
MARSSPVYRGTQSGGYTFPLILAILAAMAAGGMRLEVTTNYRLKRDREEELLFRGRAYMQAIAAFYEEYKRYPGALEELAGDEKKGQRRFIRKLYMDPITGRGFLLIQRRQGAIAGVVSASAEAPFRTANFDKDLPGFDTAKTYREWRFMAQPPSDSNGEP